MRRLSIFLLFLTMVSCSKTKVDLIVHNANIYTVDNQFSKAEAFAVNDGKFVAIGSDRKVLSHYYATKKHILVRKGKLFLYCSQKVLMLSWLEIYILQ